MLPPFFQDYDNEDIEFMKNALLDKWDVNHDGKIDKNELSMLLLQQGRMCAHEEGIDWSEDEEETTDDL